VYSVAEPYVPTLVKDTAAYGVKTATPIVNSTVEFANKTYEGTVDYTQKTVNGTVEYAKNTVNGTVAFAKNTVNDTIDYTQKTVNGVANYATAQATSAIEFSKVVVNGATTTIHAHTPGPVLTLIDHTIAGAQALRANPIGIVKPYIPTFG
jgi:hypothetical protein